MHLPSAPEVQHTGPDAGGGYYLKKPKIYSPNGEKPFKGAFVVTRFSKILWCTIFLPGVRKISKKMSVVSPLPRILPPAFRPVRIL